MIRPLAAERLATIPGDSGASIGSLAMAVSPDGESVFISGGMGRNTLYRMPLVGGDEPIRLAVLSSPIYEMVFDTAGQLWASTGGEGLLQIDPNTGAVLDSVGAGVSLGLAQIPGEAAIYVATTGGIQRFDTAERTFRPFSDTRADSLAVAHDGTLYGTAWPTGEQVIRYDFRGRAEIVAEIEGGAESISMGEAGSLQEGLLLVGHEADGRVSVLDPNSQQLATIASSGFGRVEGIESLSQGRFLVTQGEQIDLFFAVAAPQVIDVQILEGNNRANLVFDVALTSGDGTNPTSGDNPANYSIRNTATNELVSIGAVQYDEVTRTSQLLFETLPPAEYELSVNSRVESEQGIPMGGLGFSTTFRVFEDVSLSVGVDFGRTRLNRAEGTVLFDLIVTNNADFDVAGPINVVFADFVPFETEHAETVVYFGDGGVPAEEDGIQIMTDGTTLAARTSQTVTLTVANPYLLDLEFNSRVLASLPPNELPIFVSSPPTNASVAEAYTYSVNANDPDGVALNFVLAKGPDGATVNAVTGEITWTPTRGDDATTEFELRAYDSRGAYRRQEWTVNVVGANMAPVLAPIEDQRYTEGDLIEILVSGFDADGDELFYFADNMPPGAIFDPFSQALRWRPGGDAAGVYENVTLIGSDGFAESSVSFELTIANNNVAPTLSPISNRTLREGDTVSIQLFAEDEDNDAIRFVSPNIPPGGFLNPNTGTFEWTPGFDQHGEFEIFFFADDGTARAEQTASIIVENVNGQVEFAPLEEFQVFEGQTLQLRVAAFDPEFPVAPNDPLATSEDYFADFEGFIPQLAYTHGPLPDGAEYDPERQIFSWTPDFDSAGVYQIDFNVSDDGDGTGVPTTDTVTLTLDVLDANGRPEIDAIENQSLAVGGTLEIPISASDPEGAPLAIDAQIGQSTNLPDWATLTDNGDGTGSLVVNPQPGDRDDYLVTVTARETTGEGKLEEQVQFVLQATSDNEPPLFAPVFDAVLVPGVTFTLPLFVTDADQDPLTFSAAGLPDGTTLTESSIYGEATFEWTPTAADLGEQMVSFIVEDSGNGDMANQLVTVTTINLNVRGSNARPSLAPIGTQTVAEGETLSIQAQATDSDGDTIHYTAAQVIGTASSGLPRGAAFNQTTGEFTWTPDTTQAGDYRFRITASDGSGARSEDVLVTVTNTNQAPVFSQIPGLFGREGEQLIFAITAGDADGESLIYSFTGDVPDGFTFDPITRTVVWDIDFESAGDYTLPFAAIDPSDEMATLTVPVTILPTNRAPEINAPTLRNAEIGKELSLTIGALDLDGDDVTLSAEDLPEGAILNEVDGDYVLTWTPQGFQAGTHTIRLIANDGELERVQTLTLFATFDPVSPDVRIVVTPSFPASPGQEILVEPIAVSDLSVGEATLWIDGEVVELDELGRASFVATRPGRFEATATVTDEEGRSTTVTQPILVRDPGDFDAPEVSVGAITPPIVNETVGVEVNISDTGLAEYVVELVPRGATAGTVLDQGNGNVRKAIAIDPSRFANGFYTLRVTASDFGGLTTQESRDFEISSADKLGSVFETATDISVDLGGITIPVTRVYDSLNTTQTGGSFGQSWTWPLVNPQLSLNAGGSSDDVGAFRSLTDNARVYLTLPTGERVGFTFAPQPNAPIGQLETFAPAWTADDGVEWQLESLDRRLVQGGDDYFVVGTGLPYSPTIAEADETPFALVSPDGQRYAFGQTGTTSSRPSYRLTSISSGETHVRATNSGFVTATGSRLTIVRNADGNVQELVGPDGQHFVYRYNAQGLLHVAIDATDSARVFHSYDEAMRLETISSTTADGVAFEYALDGSLTGTESMGPHLGGTIQFLATPLDGTLADADTPDRYTFTITPGELRTSPSGSISISVGVSSDAFNPEAARIANLEPSGFFAEQGATVTTFTISQAGTYLLTIRGGAAGEYDAEINVVGDLNGDARVDTEDSDLFDAAFGSTRGDANYIAAADADRDGIVDSQDQAGLLAASGFVANQLAVYDDETISLLPGVASVVEFDSRIFDPEDDMAFARVSSQNMDVTPLGGGLYQLGPATDTGTLQVIADDGVIAGDPASFEVDLASNAIVGLEIINRDPQLGLNRSERLIVAGITGAGELVNVPLNAIEFDVLNESVAAVTDRGLILGQSNGTTVITVQTFGITTATAVTVGTSEARLIDVFPDAYTLGVGDTRQTLVQERLEDRVIDVNLATDGAVYVSSDPSVVTVDSDGLITATGEGDAAITVIQAGISQD